MLLFGAKHALGGRVSDSASIARVENGGEGESGLWNAMRLGLVLTDEALEAT